MNPKVYCAQPTCGAKRATFQGEVAPSCSKDCEALFYGPNPESSWNHIYSQTLSPFSSQGFSKKAWGSRGTTPLGGSKLLTSSSALHKSPRTLISSLREDEAKCDNQECNNTVSGEHVIDSFSFCSNRCYRSYLLYRDS